MHCRNAAERAIRTFKNHCMAGFTACNKDFPLVEWDFLLPQDELTLNLLWMSWVNPKLLAHMYLFGNFNFNMMPLAPPGTKVLIHRKTKWGAHVITTVLKAGMSDKPSRIIAVLNVTEVDTNTLHLLPKFTLILVYMNLDAIEKAVSDIVHI